MKFEELPVSKKIYKFVSYVHFPMDVSFKFVYEYKGSQFIFECKSCSTYAFYKTNLENGQWKPFYVVANDLREFYNNFRAIEKELKLKPCKIKLVKSNKNGIDLLEFSDPRYNNILTIDFLAILIKISDWAKKDYYDYNGILLTMLDNAELALKLLGQEKDIDKFERNGTGIQTWAQKGLLDHIVTKIKNLTKQES